MLTFGKFSKQYNVPRASVYSIMNDLEERNIDLYNECVDSSTGTKKLTDVGIQYILELRGITSSSETLERQKSDNFNTINVQDSDKDVLMAIDLLKKELDTRNRQFDILQDNYNKLAEGFKESNETLAELTKNQQLLTKQLQDNNLYIESLKHSQDKSDTVQEEKETILDNEEVDNKQKKKSFFSRLFG